MITNSKLCFDLAFLSRIVIIKQAKVIEECERYVSIIFYCKKLCYITNVENINRQQQIISTEIINISYF